MEIIYVITMALAFVNKFNGTTLWYYLKIIIALGWSVLWIIDVARKGKNISSKDIRYLKMYAMPSVLIAVWSLIVWIISPPEGFSSSYVFRMVSNITLLFVVVLNAIAAKYFFGRKAIKLSLLALALGIFANLCVVIKENGFLIFVEYLPTVLVANYSFGSKMWAFAEKLEVQGPTVAAGIFFIYFIFFDKLNKKHDRIKYIILSLVCIYIGFKRTVAFALLMVLVVYVFVSWKKISFKQLVNFAGIMFMIISIIYMVFVKYNVISIIADWLELDMMGRDKIYEELSQYYEFSPLFLGNGFAFVSKYMYETVGYGAHSEIIRMYAEIGCIPFLLWIYHYLVYVVKDTLCKEGKEIGQAALLVTVYVFSTYFMENMLLAYSVQYAFVLIPICMSEKEDYNPKIKFIL